MKEKVKTEEKKTLKSRIKEHSTAVTSTAIGIGCGLLGFGIGYKFPTKDIVKLLF